jgi:hypothetical protein
MEAIYRLKATEINTGFVDAVKKLFKNKTITITITSEPDETACLSDDPANEAYILQSMAQEPSIRFTPDEFHREVSKM